MPTPQELINVWKANAEFHRKEAVTREQEAAISRSCAETLDACVAQLEKALNDKK